MIPTGSRCGPGPASASGVRSTTRLRSSPRPSRTRTHAGSACCSGTGTSITTSTASTTTGAPRSGSSRGPGGARARFSSSKSRPTTRSTTTSSPCGCPPSRRAPGGSFALNYRLHWVGRRALPLPAGADSSPRASAMVGRPAPPRPKGVRKFMVEFLGAPLHDIPFGGKPAARAHRLARQVLLRLHRGGAGRRAGPLARPVRPHAPPARSPWRSAATCATATRS